MRRFSKLAGLRAGILIFVLVALSGGINSSPAQDVEGQELLTDIPADSLGEDAAKLVDRIKRAIDIGDEVRQKLATASHEDSLVLRLQLSNLTSLVMVDVHKLADVLVDMEAQGPQDALRIEIVDLYGYTTPRIGRYIDSLRREIDETRGRRRSTTGTDRLGLEDRIEVLTDRLNIAFEISKTHIEKINKLGLDATDATEKFSVILTDRVRELSGRIDLAAERVDDLTARVDKAPDDGDLRIELVATHKSLDVNTASMALVLDIMDTYELSTEYFRAQLVTATRDLATGLLDRDVAMGLAARAMDSVKNWFVDNGPGFLVKLLLMFAILFVFRVLARLVKSGVARALDSSKLNVSTLLRRMILTSVSNAVFLLGLLIALSQVGFTLGPLLAGLGVAGFIIGFALQDTLGNFAAGLMILIYRPYDVGDMVEISGVFGKVDKMSLVSTTILTIDNQTIVIPNSKIWGDVIKNVTAQDVRRVDMVFGISYTDDIPKAEGVLEDILKQNDKVLEDPEPVVKLHTLGESSVDFVVRPWVAVGDYWDVYWDVTRSVKMRFDEESISIPFPQRDVHIYEEQVANRREVEQGDD